MKVLILAAGYGTRMTRDLEASGQLPHLVGVPKPLLPVAGKPLISHWMDLLQSCAEIQEVYVVVSDAKHPKMLHAYIALVSTRALSRNETNIALALL